MKCWRALAGLLAAPALLTLLANCNWAFGATPASSGSEMLKLVFQRGSIQHYRYHYRFSGTSSSAAADRPLEADSAGNLTWEVTSADAGGVATILSKETSSHNGSSGLASVTTSLSNTFQLAPDGRIVTPDPTSPFNQVMFVVLPEHPVSSGDMWRRTFSQADGAIGGSMVSEGRLAQPVRLAIRNGGTRQDFIVDFVWSVSGPGTYRLSLAWKGHQLDRSITVKSTGG